MVEYGIRLIYDKKTGKIINNVLNKMCGDLPTNYRPKEIDFVDLNYDDNILENAEIYHINPITKEVIVDKYFEIQVFQTEEDKLRKEKEELENQLLLEKDNSIGGIL